MSPQPPKPPSDDDVIKEKSDSEKSFEAPKPQIVKFKADKEFVPEKLKPEKEKIEIKEVELDKFKSDYEKLPEKVKRDDEKPLEKLKPEKESKLEHKEIEKHKRDDEKPLEKFKRDDEKGKLEAKEVEQPVGGVKDKEQKEGGHEGVTGGVSADPTAGLDTDELLKHAASLEESGRRLRHFIERSLRPDLSEGALANEDDLQDASEAGGDDD